MGLFNLFKNKTKQEPVKTEVPKTETPKKEIPEDKYLNTDDLSDAEILAMLLKEKEQASNLAKRLDQLYKTTD